MLLRYLKNRLAKPPEENAPGVASNEVAWDITQDHDFMLDRNTCSSTFGTLIPDIYHCPRGFLEQETADALEALLRPSSSDAIGNLERIGRWKQPIDKRGKPVPMNTDECKDWVIDVNRIVGFLSKRKQALVSGDKKGLGKIFFSNLANAMAELGTDDPVALLEQFDNLPPNVLAHFNATERDVMSNPEVMEMVIPIAEEYCLLQKLAVDVRQQALKVLGEDAMRPTTVVREATGMRTTARMQLHEKSNRGWTTGGGSRRENGGSNFGNGNSGLDR